MDENEILGMIPQEISHEEYTGRASFQDSVSVSDLQGNTVKGWKGAEEVASVAKCLLKIIRT